MIQEFSIDGIGCLSELHSGPLKKSVLVFGENGAGKSTIVAALRSLKDNDPSLIFERKPVGNEATTSVSLTAFDETYSFDEKWNQEIEGLAIFDQTYINRNIHSGDSLDNDHKKQLYTVILGDSCADKLVEQQELNETIKQHNQQIKDLEKEISGHIHGDLDLKEFFNLPRQDDIDETIQRQSELVSSFEQSDKLNRMDGFEQIELPRIPNSFNETLACTIENLSSDAEKQVNDHLKKGTKNGTTNWIEQGIQIQKKGKCPFCGESTTSNELIKTYQDYFNKEYAGLKSEVDGLPKTIEGYFGEAIMLKLQKLISANQAGGESWQNHIDLPPFEHDIFEQLSTELVEIRDHLLELVQQKSQSPLDELQLDDKCSFSEQLVEKVEQYNSLVDVANGRIEELRESQNQGDLRLEKEKLMQLQSTAARHSAEGEKLVDQWKKADATKHANATKRKELQASIEEETSTVFAEQGESINEILEQLDAGFRLGSLVTNNRTKPPSVQLCIEINDQDIQFADKVSGSQRPFRSTLSGAERMMLAFAFFISKLDQDSQDTIVVIDDPVTNLDQIRLNKTADIIAESCASTSQLIMFSHNPEFLESTATQLSKKEVQRLQLTRSTPDTPTQLGESDAWEPIVAE